MEQLQSLAISEKSKISKILAEFMGAILLGLGLHGSFISIFSLEYSPRIAFKGGIIDGFIACWNEISYSMGTRLYIIIPTYEGAGDKYGFFLSILLVLFIAISWLIIKADNGLLLLVYIVPIILASLIWSINPSPWTVTVLSAGVLIALYLLRVKDAISLWVVIGIILAISLAMGLAINSFSKSYLQQPTIFQSIKIYGEKGIDYIRFGSKTIDKDEEAFQITMEKPSQMWLRGFVGEIHDSKGWREKDTKSQFEYIPIGKAFKQEGFNPLGQIGQVADLLEAKENTKGKVEIEIKNAYSKYLFVPYEIEKNNISGSKNYGDSFIKSKGLFGTKNYSYIAGQDVTHKWTNLTGIFYGREQSKALENYITHEEYENIDVYKRFTYIGEDDILALYQEFGGPGNQEKGHISYREVIDKVLEFTNDKMLYSESKNYPISDIDEIKGFNGIGSLEEPITKKIGDDRAIASIATLIFRYYGIPSRYIEGYQITKKDAAIMKAGEEYSIKGKNFHAWSEIYVDGIGWVPIEVIPEFIDRMKQADLTVGIENSQFTNSFKAHEQSSEEEMEENILEKDAKVEKNTSIKRFLLIIGILLFLALTIKKLLKKSFAIVKRKQNFQNKDVKLAICHIYADMCKRNFEISDDIRRIGERAAFSTERAFEEDREFMIAQWKQLKKSK